MRKSLIILIAIVVSVIVVNRICVDRGPDPFAKRIPPVTSTASHPTRTTEAIPTQTPVAPRVASTAPRSPTPTPEPKNGILPEPTPTPHPQRLQRFTDASWLRQEDPNIYRAILELGWVSDGISSHESDPVQALIYLGINEPTIADVLMRMNWMTDAVSEDEGWVITSLSGLTYDVPEAAERIISMPWLADSVDTNESWAVTSLAGIALESHDSVSTIISSPWYADGISQDESLVLEMLGAISYDTGAASRFVGMPFLDSIEPADHHALGSLAILGYEYPNEFDRVLSHPVLADGITDEETPIVTLLYDVRSTNPSLVDTILEPTSTSVEERDIELPLAGPVRLTIVRIQPGASRSMDLLEDAVRFAEDHMGEPLPTNFVLLFYADAVMPDYAGHNSGFNMTVHPDFDSDDDSDEAQHAPFILAHEVAHYYWNTSAQLWLDEGAAEVMSIIYGETTTSQEVWGAADTYPCAFAADLTGVERLTDTQAEDCAYSLGTRFFLDLYRTLGEDEFRRGFRELYRMGMDILDSEDSEARSIDHVRDAFSFSEAARDEIIPKWYWSPP